MPLVLLAGTAVRPGDAAHIAAELGRLEPLKATEPGVSVLTTVLENDHAFHLVAVGPYDSSRQDGIYAIWLKTPV
jgi:hypothetical protein